MASHLAELCPVCRVVFVASPMPTAARGQAKRCPNGHLTSVDVLRARRPPHGALPTNRVWAVLPPQGPTRAELLTALQALLASYHHVEQTLPSHLGRAIFQGGFQQAVAMAEPMAAQG